MISYKLSSNEKPFPPLPGVAQAMFNAIPVANRYPDPASSELTEAIAFEHRVSPGQVVIGTGSVALCYHAAQAVADPGDEIIFAWRSFEAYPILTSVVGARPVAIPLTADDQHDLEAMVEAVTPATRLIFVCTPNNPTGTAVSAERMNRFLDTVPGDVLVVVDEAYAEFVCEKSAVCGVDLVRERANVLVLRTFSKAYGLAGLRVGYGLATEPVADAIRRTTLPFPITNLGAAAAVASLAHRGELFERVESIVAERERVSIGLRALGLDVGESQANFVWLRLGASAAALSAACDQRGLAIRTFPGEGVRVTVGEPEANDRFLQVAADFLRT